jgi:hypothetical protein
MSDPRIAALTQLLADTEGGGYSEHAYRLIEAGVGLPSEIARLRRIEEAARAHVALFDTMNYPDTAAMYPDALRAALEEKP